MQGALAALGVYLVAGVLVGVWFVAWGVRRIDPVARSGTIGFRLCILPGVAAFWPAMLARWFRARRAARIEQQANGGAS